MDNPQWAKQLKTVPACNDKATELRNKQAVLTQEGERMIAQGKEQVKSDHPETREDGKWNLVQGRKKLAKANSLDARLLAVQQRKAELSTAMLPLDETFTGRVV